MVTILVALLLRFRTALAELTGATIIVVALAQWNGTVAACVAGAAVLAKSAEWGLEDAKRVKR